MKKKYLAIYLGSPEAMAAWDDKNEKQQAEMQNEGIKAWAGWAQKNSKLIKDIGNPLGDTIKVNPKGISATSNQMTAYTIVEAESHEEAAKLFQNHPHFTIFPGDSIEVMECLDLPS